MKKTLFYLFLFCSLFQLKAQDTTVVVKNPINTKVIWKESDIKIDSDSVTKKHFETNFKSKYKDEAFVYDVKKHEKNAWDRFKEWLANIFSRLFSFTSREASMNFVTILMKIIAVSIIIFVIYLIVKSIMNKEGQWVFGKNSDKKLIRYDDLEKNLRIVDFEKLIKETLNAGENRLCIRYYYLWLLKKMSEREIIIWDLEKTNSDYLNEIKNEQLKADFAYLSYLYNYIWYGEFELDVNTFDKAKTAFEKTIQSI